MKETIFKRGREMEPKDAGELGEHFKKLLDLKAWIAGMINRTSSPLLIEVYEKLDDIIKEGKE